MSGLIPRQSPAFTGRLWKAGCGTWLEEVYQWDVSLEAVSCVGFFLYVPGLCFLSTER